MKKVILIAGILIASFSAQAQYAKYKVSMLCIRYYDMGLEVWKDWSSWENWSGTIEVSSVGIRYITDENERFLYIFGENVPSQEWLFYKKHTMMFEGEEDATGTIYTNATLETLLSGSFRGEIYIYREYVSGIIAINGYRIEPIE